jgi:hypothetical protein
LPARRTRPSEYGLVKVVGVDPKGAVVSKRNKYVFFAWQGPSVPAMKRVPATDAKRAIAGYFQGHHLSLELDDRAGLDEADLEKRLRASGGAHQPERFEFGSGSTISEFTAATQPVAAGKPAAAATEAAAAAPAE